MARRRTCACSVCWPGLVLHGWCSRGCCSRCWRKLGGRGMQRSRTSPAMCMIRGPWTEPRAACCMHRYACQSKRLGIVISFHCERTPPLGNAAAGNAATTAQPFTPSAAEAAAEAAPLAAFPQPQPMILRTGVIILLKTVPCGIAWIARLSAQCAVTGDPAALLADACRHDYAAAA